MIDHSFRFRAKLAAELSAADLFRECGRRLTDRNLWAAFQERFRGPIFKYVYRALKEHSRSDDVQELVSDLGQEVYLRLLQNDGETLKSFRGETDFSVMALLGRIAVSVVADHFRKTNAGRRSPGAVVSIDEAKEMTESSTYKGEELDIASILSWIDVERIVAADPDRKNAQRNALIFKLHYIDGFSPAEISRFRVFDLKADGIESVLSRVRKRIRK